MMNTYRLCAFADEASPKLAEQIVAMRENNIEFLEMRGVDGTNVAKLTVQQAKDAAKEVKRWGEAVKLPEMNAHDRRIIHLTLQDDPEITTESEGEGSFKKVVVSLKKAE